MMMRSTSFWSSPTLIDTIALAMSSETRFITLISGLMAGPAVSLNGSPTVSPMIVASWAGEPLPPWWPSSTSFLALSQAPPELARKTAIRVPVPIAPARKPASAVDAETEAHRDGRQHRQDARRDQLAQRVLGDDVDDLAVLRTAGALHDPGDLAELAADLVDHGAGRAGDRVDGQTGEQEHHGRTEEHADQDQLGLKTRKSSSALPSSAVTPAASTSASATDVGVGAEQRGRGQHGGRDRDALGDRLGGVADRVELGQDLRALGAHVTGHLRDALGVVGDRTEGVHGHDHADRGQQTATGQRHREQRDRHESRHRAGRRRTRPRRSPAWCRRPTRSRPRGRTG